MSKRNVRQSFESYLVPFSLLFLLLLGTLVTIANLPPNKIFAGHDSGFYTLFPDQLIRTSAGTWEVKTALGFVNFQALVTLPFALLVFAVHALHPSAATVGRFFFELQILLCAFGSFSIAWLILDRFYPETSLIARSIASIAAAFVATFNIFTAVLLLYPPSNFQMGVFIWPPVVAFELYFLWKRATISAAILFGIAVTLATLGNPAHTILGLAIVAGIYIADSRARNAWRWPLLATVALVALATSAFFWLPAFASVVVYHGNVSAPEGADTASLLSSQQLIAQRATIANLLRFDGLLWWPKTRNAPLYGSTLMLLGTYVPVILATIALFSRKWIASASCAVLLIGVILAKSVHPPFPINMIGLMSSVPVFAAFRQAYDKFALYILLGLPAASAVGLVILLRSRRLLPAGIVAVALIFLSAWPFLSGRIAEPYFLTNIPADYGRVNAIMGEDPQARVLSLPGAANEIYVINWFKGGNFENLLLRTHAVNGAIFKQRSISAAPLYDDFDLTAAQELPQIIGLLGVYDVGYVLLHKDYLTDYRMAFDSEPYKVLGPLTARLEQRFLDADDRLQKIYEGHSLVLYRVRFAATLPHAYGSYSAGVATSYENTLFGVSDAGLLESATHPNIIFLGNQVLASRISDKSDTLSHRADFLLEAPVIPETPALYREQASLPPKAFQTLVGRYDRQTKPTYFTFVQPHGDWLKGNAPRADNLVGIFSLKQRQRSDVLLNVVAKPVAGRGVQLFFGPEEEPPWPVSALSEEPSATAVLTEGSLVDPSATGMPSIKPTVSVYKDKTSAVYQFPMHRAGDTDEGIVISRAIRSMPLLNDPKVTFDYEFFDPNIQVAWLRFELSDPSQHRYFFDKQLDPTGHLEAYDVRNGLQTALDAQFDQAASAHENRRAWFVRQVPFGAPQADHFSLRGLRVIIAKPPYTDFSQTLNLASLRLYDLQVTPTYPDPPMYASEAYRLDFASARMRSQLKGVSDIHVVSQGRALVFTATVPTTKVGSSVSLRVPLPLLDMSKHQLLRVRYWQPSAAEKLSVRLGITSTSGTREVEGGLDSEMLPPEWVAKADFERFEPPLVLDNRPTGPVLDQGWRDAAFDVRRLAAYHGVTLRPKLAYIVVEMKITPLNLPNGVQADFQFALGDLALVDAATSAVLRPPRQAPLLIDGRAHDATSVLGVHGAENQFVLRFPKLQFAAGEHRIATLLSRPWSVRSVTISPDRRRDAHPPVVSIRHIDDELFAVHVDRHRPMWLSFAETYHSGWRLINAAAPRDRLRWAASLRWLSKPAGEHIMANAYNNTWFIDGSAPADYVIDFAPQDFAVLGKALALTALAFALGAALFMWRR